MSLLQGPVNDINVSEDEKEDGFLSDHVSRTETSERILALIGICVSVSVTSYLSDGRDDVKLFVSTSRLGLGCSKREISQWRPI